MREFVLNASPSQHFVIASALVQVSKINEIWQDCENFVLSQKLRFIAFTE